MTRVLSADDITRCISMREAIEVVKEAFRQLSMGEAQAPLRTHLQMSHGSTFVMPAATSSALGVKVVSIRENNVIDGLPTVPAMVMLLDSRTGMPRALLDGTYLTRLRTGAAVGAATDLLARTETATMVMMGAGALAPFCIDAVAAVRPIRALQICSRSSPGVERLADWCRREHPGVFQRGFAGRVHGIHDAEIVVCATTSTTPVFSSADLKPGAHVNGIGSYRPDMQEVDVSLVQRAKVVVDSREACLLEAGDLIIPIGQGLFHASQIHAELGEIISGLQPGREREEEITFFKSVGNAIQDIAVASAIVERAEQLKLGQQVHA